MVKNRILAVLLVISITTSAGVSSSAQRVDPHILLASQLTQSVQNSIRLWYEVNGDLWIATPFYVWNITGGNSITVGDDTKFEWSPYTYRVTDRAVDVLFLFPGSGTQIKSRILYSLPDEALVYLERLTPKGIEGLELSFRTEDGLIRLTHRVQGMDTPIEALKYRPTLVAANKPAIQDITGTVFVTETALLPEEYHYSVNFDPVTRQGYALLQREDLSKVPKQSQIPCPEQLGTSKPTVYDSCQFPNYFLPGHVVGSEYLFLYRADSMAFLQPIKNLVARLQLALPDLDAASITQTPRYNYDASKNKPYAGDLVTFVARVANRGSQATGSFAYTWFIDDIPVLNNTSPSLAPGTIITLSLNWLWQTGHHTIRIQLDPQNTLSEVSKQNNVVEIQTDSLMVGFWVEQSVYDWFNLHQVELGLGSVSWDDWAQRQLRIWNQMFADSISPLTPQGITDRVRLDQVVIIPDGTWEDCANWPNPEDRTVDLVWGFPSELVGVSSGRTCPPLNFYINNPEAQTYEPSLLHELSHARYLVDLYGLNMYAHHVLLSSSVDSTTQTLIVDQNVENDSRFPVPAYLAIEGELVVCQSKAGNTFNNCSRGAEGTTARSHSANTPLNLATVRVQDGGGNLVQGSSALPLLGDFHDHLYFNRYPDDVMSGGTIYRQHSAYAWNRITGQRPICGNYNAPCNIGEYLNDIPQHNILEIHGGTGQLLAGARVDIYQGRPFPIWYGRIFLKNPDATYYTDSQGRVDLGHFPFGSDSSIIHTYGYSNALFFLKISYGGRSIYEFFEVTRANEAYWSGNQDRAIYTLNSNLGASVWLGTASLPQPLSTPMEMAGRQLVFHKGRVYVFGGKNAGDNRLTNVFYSTINADGSLGAWIETTPLPGQYYDQTTVQVGDYVYLITGAAGSTAVYYAPFNIDGSLGTWIETSSLDPSRQNSAVVSYGNYIYISGGNSGGTLNNVKIASVKPDGSLNSWTDTTPLPEAMEGHAMVAYNGWLYVLAPNSVTYRAPIQAAGMLGNWTTITSLPQTMSGYTSFEHNGSLYLLGGNSSSVYEAPILADGSLGTWQNKSQLPEQRSGLWAGGSNGFLYAVGGHDGSSYRDTVYYLMPQPIPSIIKVSMPLVIK